VRVCGSELFFAVVQAADGGFADGLEGAGG
jgi:hypothetical protein